MQHLSLLLKPASSRCNLRCSYCFYADVSSRRAVRDFGVMQPETVAALLSRVFGDIADGGSVTFAFQGGEPTLAGLPFFEDFVAQAQQAMAHSKKRVQVSWALQTNGVLLDEAWCAFLARHNFLTGLSLDGDAALHDANRVDARDKGTYKRVLAAKTLLERFGAQYNVLWVLTNHAARFPQKAWAFLQAQGIQFVQFIPCLPALEDDTPSPHALTPERFASFYKGLYPLWAAALAQGRYTSVKLFDDVCNLLGRGNVTACGLTGNCQAQFVVEADGSVYPCDFYVLDAWSIGNLTRQTPQEILRHPQTQAFLARPRTQSALCEACPYRSVCGGGCPRMRSAMYLAAEGQFCGYRALLDACGAQLQDIGRRFAGQ